VSVRCCVVLEIYCSEHVISMKVWNVILWLNPWDKWCYTMSDKITWIVLSWTCYTYIICVCALSFISTYLFRDVINSLLCIVYVWIPRWSWILCSWEKIVRSMTLKKLVLEDAKTQYSDRLIIWSFERPYFELEIFSYP